jgi:kynurenine 3-monooxygenase
MVMFHPEIPYAVAQQRGAAQQALLKELARGAAGIEDIDIDDAVQQVSARLPALPAG